ncbi:hypothetical protein BH24ACT22_BH24ACT22_12610 [soil metagenome]
MTLTELVDRDFNRARWRQRFGRLLSHLKVGSDPALLICFAEERSRETIIGHRSLGIQAMELARVEGSVGRCRDFDLAFMPACLCLGERWRRVDLAFRENKQLPPVRLYKLGERYFVEDGNHRVSVARYKDLPMIEAEVTELLYDEVMVAPANESGSER